MEHLVLLFGIPSYEPGAPGSGSIRRGARKRRVITRCVWEERWRVGLTADQRRIVEWGDGPVVVIAGAGTGKTRVIVERVRWLLETKPDLLPGAPPGPDLQRQGRKRSCRTDWTRRSGRGPCPDDGQQLPQLLPAGPDRERGRRRPAGAPGGPRRHRPGPPAQGHRPNLPLIYHSRSTGPSATWSSSSIARRTNSSPPTTSMPSWPRSGASSRLATAATRPRPRDSGPGQPQAVPRRSRRLRRGARRARRGPRRGPGLRPGRR